MVLVPVCLCACCVPCLRAVHVWWVALAGAVARWGVLWWLAVVKNGLTPDIYIQYMQQYAVAPQRRHHILKPKQHILGQLHCTVRYYCTCYLCTRVSVPPPDRSGNVQYTILSPVHPDQECVIRGPSKDRVRH